MGAALYIVLDNREPGFDTFVNGKAISEAAEELETVTDALGMKVIWEYVDGNFADAFDDEDEPEEERADGEPADASELAWFDAAEGVAYFKAISEHLRAHPDALSDADAVLSDLDEYIALLERCAAAGAKWHLEVDY